MHKKINQIQAMATIDEKVNAILEICRPKSQLPVNIDNICNKMNITVEPYDFSGVENNLKKQIPTIKIFGALMRNSRRILVDYHAGEKSKKFIAAHEMAHFFCDQADNNVSFMAEGISENKKYDLFAAKLLMPKDDLIKEYDNAAYPTVSHFSKIFDVPEHAVKIIMKELELDYIDL